MLHRRDIYNKKKWIIYHAIDFILCLVKHKNIIRNEITYYISSQTQHKIEYCETKV